MCGFRIEARREIYGGNGLGVAFSAIISMFALSNVSKVSSIGISGKLVCKRLACTEIFYLDCRGKVFHGHLWL